MNDLTQVDHLLSSFCTQKTTKATSLHRRYGELWQEISHYLAAGGKRIRPRLVIFGYEAYKTKAVHQDITPIAAAWELLHACLLVHDDIIDRDILRHGQPNIAGRYQSIYGSNNEHYALSAALLGGDLLLMSAYEMISSADVSPEAKQLALSHLNAALFTVAGGELIDTDSALYPVTDSDPYAVAAYKTASYSLQLPLQCGAAVAGASEDELEKLSSTGLHVGVAYQFRDDLLGVFGNSEETGKSNRSDILEKKRTALIHETLNRLDTAAATRLSELYAPEHVITSKEAEEVVALILQSGAKEATERIVEAESAKALSGIEALNIHAQHKEYLSGIIAKLITRTR